MTDKKTVAHEYLHGPRRKGAYNVEHGGHGTPHRQQIELKKRACVPCRKPRRRRPSQSHSPSPVCRYSPTKLASRHRHRHRRARSHRRRSSNTDHAATQTMPAADASTQTSTPQAPAQGDGAPQTAGEHSSTGAPHSPREPASSPDHHKTTQTSSPDRANRGTTTPMPDSTDAGVQNGADMQDGSTQHAPPQHSVQTQTSVPVTSTRTTPAPQPPQLHVSEPTNGNETTTATRGRRTARYTRHANRHRDAKSNTVESATTDRWHANLIAVCPSLRHAAHAATGTRAPSDHVRQHLLRRNSDRRG